MQVFTEIDLGKWETPLQKSLCAGNRGFHRRSLLLASGGTLWGSPHLLSGKYLMLPWLDNMHNTKKEVISATFNGADPKEGFRPDLRQSFREGFLPVE